MSDNLPALAGSATGDNNIAVALESLVSHLQHRAEHFDDVSISLHSEKSSDGATRSVFSYRAYKHRVR